MAADEIWSRVEPQSAYGGEDDFHTLQAAAREEESGARCRTRTYDPVIKSHLLYQLS